jgi:sulfite reductase (NADPH) flavoprotein alpha-component
VRKLILNLHLFTALCAGVFMVIQGITGSIIAFEPELDRTFHSHLAYIKSEPQVLSAKDIMSAASRQLGGEPVVAYEPSSSPVLSSEVFLPNEIAYVNQYTGEVLGVRLRGQTFLGYVRAIHTRLALGAIGRNILRWSAVAALFSAISGLYLWWPTKRITIQMSGGAKRFWFDLHSLIGICSLIPLMLLAASGVVLGFEDQAASLVYRITHSAPTQISHSARKAPTGTPIIDVDAALAIARSCLPGAVPYRIQMPQYGGLYRVELTYPDDPVAGSRNIVTLDPADGAVVSLIRSADLSRGDWILAANEAIHTGSIFGMPTRVLASLSSMIVFVQAVSGAFIWLHRKRIL